MLTRILIFAAILFGFNSLAQISTSPNLVLNPGLEECKCGSTFFFQGVTDWSQINSADYINDSCWVNGLPYWESRSGHAVAGIYVYGEYEEGGTTYFAREYIIGRLKEPLQAGEAYSTSFYVRPSGYLDGPETYVTIEDIGLSFISDLSELTPNNFLLSLPYDIRNDNGPITELNTFTQVGGCYEARGDERYFVIGNFLKDAETVTTSLGNVTNYDNAYFLVDDVQVRNIEPFDLPYDAILCAGETITIGLSDSLAANYTSFSWARLNDITPSIQVDKGGLYKLTAKVGNCSYSDQIWVKESECYDCPVYIPNIISPNGDGFNDELRVQVECPIDNYELSVYDRWGNQVFLSTNIFERWSGSYEGSAVPSGVFLYQLKLHPSGVEGNEVLVKSGDITVVR